MIALRQLCFWSLSPINWMNGEGLIRGLERRGGSAFGRRVVSPCTGPDDTAGDKTKNGLRSGMAAERSVEIWNESKCLRKKSRRGPRLVATTSVEIPLSGSASTGRKTAGC